MGSTSRLDNGGLRVLDLGQGLGIKTLEKWRKGDYLGTGTF